MSTTQPAGHDYDGHVMRTPDEWCRIHQIQILDADGWRGRDAKDWNEPLTELDFMERANVCTQRSTAGDTQPAGEHAGEGNAATPVSIEIVGIAWTAAPGARFNDIRAALEAAYPAIRQQVAQEIAAALDAIPGTAYPEDVLPPDGTSTDCQSARVMRSAYPAAARIAREIGGVE